MPKSLNLSSPGFRAAVLSVGLLIFSLAFQGNRGLWEPDEGRYTNVALEMISLDDWLVPHMHSEHPHWTKPPLTYWAIAASFKIFGRSEFAARLPSALSFFVTAILLGLLGQIFLERQPLNATLVYATSLLPFAAANLVTTDSLLTLWEVLAVYAFARATWHPRCRRELAWQMLMWAAFGLAFLTKGPPGWLPLFAITAFTLTTPELRGGRTLRVWPGILVMLAVALPWYLLVVYRHPGLLSYFVEQEVVARVASDEFRRHSEWYGGFKVYLPTLLARTLPWTGWLLGSAWRGIATLRQRGRETFNSLDTKQRFLLWWLLLPLALFFVSRSRLPLYVLPLAAPLTLLICRELQQRRAFPSRRGAWLLTVWMCALLVLRGAAGLVESPKDASAAAASLREAGVEGCDEIAFYETRPMLGLRYYMDCEVEDIAAGDLAEELQEPERRLWAVDAEHAAGFEANVRANGRGYERVVELPGLWSLYRELDGPADRSEL